MNWVASYCLLFKILLVQFVMMMISELYHLWVLIHFCIIRWQVELCLLGPLYLIYAFGHVQHKRGKNFPHCVKLIIAPILYCIFSCKKKKKTEPLCMPRCQTIIWKILYGYHNSSLTVADWFVKWFLFLSFQ